MTLSDVAARLARLDLETPVTDALAVQAEALAAHVRDALDHRPPEPHTYPYRVTGALHDSIAVSVEGNDAIVGSTDAVAAFQERGTARVPPRPFLAPMAARHGAECAHAIGAALAAALGAA